MFKVKVKHFVKLRKDKPIFICKKPYKFAFSIKIDNFFYSFDLYP